MEDRLKKINQYFLSGFLSMNYSSVRNKLEEDGFIIDYSYRSFNRDIQNLKERLAIRYPSLEEEYGNLLRFSVSKKEYYYIREDISAFPALSQSELTDLAKSISLNKHLFKDGLGEGLINKLEAIQLENNLNQYQHFSRWPAIQLIKDGNRSGGEWLKPILEAIYSSKIIEISHKGLKSGSKVKKIQAFPLMVKEYNNGWFTGWYLVFQPVIEGENILRLDLGKLWVFALDRILDIFILKEKPNLRIPEGFNPGDYFKNNLGIYPKSKKLRPEKLILKIKEDSWILKYLEKYPLHDTQRIIGHSNDYFAEYHLEINNELEAFLWEYIRELEIIQPIHLRKKFLEEINSIQSLLNTEP